MCLNKSHKRFYQNLFTINKFVFAEDFISTGAAPDYIVLAREENKLFAHRKGEGGVATLPKVLSPRRTFSYFEWRQGESNNERRSNVLSSR